MSFNSYEELMQVVEERRADVLTLEVDMGAKYSPEYEAAKRELKQAEALKSLTGDQQFLNDNVEALQRRVAELKPESRPVWIRYRRLPLAEWSMLVKKNNLTPIEQYESVLKQTFVGLYGQDPDTPGVEPLTTDPQSLSSKGAGGVLEGGDRKSVV